MKITSGNLMGFVASDAATRFESNLVQTLYPPGCFCYLFKKSYHAPFAVIDTDIILLLSFFFPNPSWYSYMYSNWFFVYFLIWVSPNFNLLYLGQVEIVRNPKKVGIFVVSDLL